MSSIAPTMYIQTEINNCQVLLWPVTSIYDALLKFRSQLKHFQLNETQVLSLLTVNYNNVDKSLSLSFSQYSPDVDRAKQIILEELNKYIRQFEIIYNGLRKVNYETSNGTLRLHIMSIFESPKMSFEFFDIVTHDVINIIGYQKLTTKRELHRIHCGAKWLGSGIEPSSFVVSFSCVNYSNGYYPLKAAQFNYYHQMISRTVSVQRKVFSWRHTIKSLDVTNELSYKDVVECTTSADEASLEFRDFVLRNDINPLNPDDTDAFLLNEWARKK